MDTFELFEELDEDVRTYLISSQLPLLSSLLLSMTCRKYNTLILLDLGGSINVSYDISTELGELGSPTVFRFFVDEKLRWRVSLQMVVERAIAKGQLSFLSFFSIGPTQKFMDSKSTLFCYVNESRIAFLAGENGSQEVAKWVEDQFNIHLEPYFYLNGLALGGHFALLKTMTLECERSDKRFSYENIFSFAFSRMHRDILDWLLEEKVTFVETEAIVPGKPKKAFTTPSHIFFSSTTRVQAGLRAFKDTGHYLSGIKYLEAHGATLEASNFVRECVSANNLETVKYLQDKYHSLKTYPFEQHGGMSFNSLLSADAYETLIYMVETVPDSFPSWVRDRFYSDIDEACIRKSKFYLNEKYFAKKLRGNYFTRLAKFMLLCKEKLGLPSIPHKKVLFRNTEVAIQQWTVIIQRVSKTSEFKSFLKCMDLLYEMDLDFPETFKKVLQEILKETMNNSV